MSIYGDMESGLRNIAQSNDLHTMPRIMKIIKVSFIAETHICDNIWSAITEDVHVSKVWILTKGQEKLLYSHFLFLYIRASCYFGREDNNMLRC